MITKDDFRKVMSTFATGVTVVTTLDDDGKPHGMTANAFTSVCLDPPTILICVDHKTNTYGFVESNKKFGVNILGDDQESIANFFARPPEDKQGHISYRDKGDKSCSPILDNAIAFLGCSVIDSHIIVDHTIYIARVDDVITKDAGNPLLFFRSGYKLITPDI